jgi:hypothetical protein
MLREGDGHVEGIEFPPQYVFNGVEGGVSFGYF